MLRIPDTARFRNGELAFVDLSGAIGFATLSTGARLDRTVSVVVGVLSVGGIHQWRCFVFNDRGTGKSVHIRIRVVAIVRTTRERGLCRRGLCRQGFASGEWAEPFCVTFARRSDSGRLA